ncbi:MAG: TonB-dependent receptor [Acidobacteria bacterium]|nr:TonB-dependent receptor [Acidobacteriota bacterium]
MTRLLALFIALTAAHAQDARGRITGRIQDPSGAPVPRAAVEAMQTETRVRITATTNDAGVYELLYLAPGAYAITVTAQGFETIKQSGVEVRMADRLQQDFTLTVGQVSESVQVSARVSLIDTASASLGQVTDTRRIVDLPLPAGNSQTLAQYAPGVINMAAPNHPSLGTGAVDVLSNIAVNGARTYNVEFTIDGAPSMWGRNAAYSPPTEMVAEVKVQTATYDATVGRVPGGNVNMVLKTGTNQLHWVAQFFHTNQHLWALSLFSRQFLYNPATGPLTEAKRAQVNPLTILNRWSGTASGPVVLPKLYDGRNRTFWTFSYEGIYRTQSTLGGLSTMPTLAQRKGDFSALLPLGAVYQIYDPLTTTAAAGGRFARTPFPGNILPSARLDKTAQNLLQFYPEPNLAGLPNGTNNYQTQSSNINRQVSLVSKVDHNFSDRHRMFVRWNHGSQLFISNGIVKDNKTNVTDRWRRSQAAVFDDVYVLSASLVNNFRMGFTRFSQASTPEMLGFDLVGAGYSPALSAAIDPKARQFPTLAVAGYQSIGGAANNEDTTTYLTASNDVSWTRGTTMFRFGGEYRVYRNNQYQLLPMNPSLTFNSRWTNGPLDTAAAAPTGQGMASFLLGIPSQGSVSQNDSYADQSMNYALYFQSDWRISRTLTVNAGLRYDYDSPMTERFNRSVRNFDATTANPIASAAIAAYTRNPIPEIPASQFRVNGGLTFAGIGGLPREIWEASRWNFAPRIGIAWQARPGTVIRTGYGIFYVPQGVDRQAVNQTGFTAATALNPSLDNGLTYIASLSNPFPSGFVPSLGSSLGLRTGLGQGVSVFLPELKAGYLQRWSFGLQHQLPKRIFVDVSYVASRGTRLDSSRQYNAIPEQYLSKSPVRDTATINYLAAQVANPFYPLLPSTGLAGTTVARSQLLRPYPHFTGVSANEPNGYSWYHSMQVLTERRFQNGFTAQFNWVWSKFMEATAFRNGSDPRPEKLISDLDRTHVVHFSGIYEVPFGRGKPLFNGNTPVVRHIAGGWQGSASWQRHTGAPIGFGNALLTGSLQDIPLGDAKTIARWFNINAFNRNAADQLASNLVGLSTRFSGVRAPAVDVWNMSGMKRFTLPEKMRMEFRAEFLNALNRTNLAAPNTNPTNLAFGSITSTPGSQRSIVFGMKLVY